jgi:hypothetical protein
MMAAVVLGVFPACSSEDAPSAPSAPATSSEAEQGEVPTATQKVYLATALACSKLDTEDAVFVPAVVSGSGFQTTIEPTEDCREQAIFNSYVYDVPTPDSGSVEIAPGNQPAVTLDAERLSASGAATVYYAREGAGEYSVTVIKYKKTGDVKEAS